MFSSKSLLNLVAILALSGALFLTGCGISTQDAALGTAIPGVAIQGHVHGGAYPIQGATIRLMETQSTGTWSTSSMSYTGTAKQLLTTTSDSTGYFTFPDTGWTCDAGQYAYITVTSGHTTTTTNNNVVQVGVIGSCSGRLSTVSQIDNVNVFISELSTVAAAYALGNFMSIDSSNASTGQQLVNIVSAAANNATSPVCTGTGSAMTCTAGGLGHAFDNAYNLVDSVRYDGSFPTGTARTSIPGNTASVVPQALINTLGNILQSCVDSGGGAAINVFGTYYSDTSHCGDLFVYGTPPGGTAPTNTLQVALNMADYPNNNVASLYALQPRAVFFTPTLTSGTMSGTTTPISFSLSIFYTGTGLSGDLGMPTPVDVALDANDNAYVVYTNSSGGYTAVDGFYANGKGLFAGARQTTLGAPSQIAIDNLGLAWVPNDSTSAGTVNAFSTSSGALSKTITVAGNSPGGVAVDKSNNIWVVRDIADSNQVLFRYTAGNAYATTAFNTTPALGLASKRISIDGAQNIYGVSNSGTSTATAFLFQYGNNGAATVITRLNLGASAGSSLVTTSTNHVYLPLNGLVNTVQGYVDGSMTLNVYGSNANSSGTGFSYTLPQATALDSGYNLYWTDNTTNGQIFKIGASTAGNISTTTKPTSFQPCYVSGGVCVVPAGGNNFRGLAVDSSGAMWTLSNGGLYSVVQTLGFAAPAWPLLSYSHVALSVN